MGPTCVAKPPPMGLFWGIMDSKLVPFIELLWLYPKLFQLPENPF